MADSVVAIDVRAAAEPDRGGALRWVCLVLALVSWWLSGELTWQSLGQAGSSPLLQALCTGDSVAGSDCRSVIATEWGAVPLSANPSAPRIPTAAFGMGYFAAIALWLLFVGLPVRCRLAWHLPFLALLLIGGLASTNLLYVMGGVLKRWCLACTAVHALNLAIFVLTVGGFVFRRAAATSPRLMPSTALAALTASTLALLLHLSFVLALVFNRSVLPLQEAYYKIARDPEFAKWQYEREPVVAFPADELVAAVGPVDAPNTIVIFSDFQCPVCRVAHRMINETLAERPDEFRAVHRNYPLNTACNPQVKITKHAGACAGASATEAALEAGGPQAAIAMRDRLYERQTEIGDDACARWAGEIGIDPKGYAAARASPKIAERIARDIALAEKVGISTTPVIFVNGRRFDYWREEAAWRAVLGLPPKASATSAPSR